MIAMAANLAAMAPMSSEATFCEGKIAADCVRMGFACVMVVSMAVFLGKLLAKGLDGWRSYGTRSLVCCIGIGPVILFYAMNIFPDELLEARYFAVEVAALHSTGARVFSPILHVFYELCMTVLLNGMVRLYAEIWRIYFLRKPFIIRSVTLIAFAIIFQNNFIDIRRCRVCGLVLRCALGQLHAEFVCEFIRRMYNTYANRVHRVAATSSQSPLQDSLHR